VRLKTAEIAYTFQQKFVKDAGLGSMRVYLNGNNIYLWTKMPDDREGTFAGDAGAAYPMISRFNLGVELSF